MKNYTLIISEIARKDLNDIWLYSYEKWSISQADRYFYLLNNNFLKLASRKKKGKINTFFHDTYYVLKVKLHLIFYKLDEEKNELIILKILHKRMDIVRRLKK